MKTRVGPWVVWLATMTAIFVLYSDVNDRGRVLGFAYGIEYKVAAPAQGRIKSVAVEIGQTVKRGDVIAILDGSNINAQIREAEALKRKVAATIDATSEEVRQRSARTARTLDVSIEENEVNLEQAQANHRIKRTELKALGIQLKRLRGLVRQKLAPARNLPELEIQHAALKSQVATAATTTELLKKRLQSARARRATLAVDPVEVAIGPLKEEIRILETRLAHLRYQKGNLVLRAPAAGQVYRIIQRPGDVAAAGQTIVRLIGSKSDRVVACVSEYEALSVQVGAKATLFRRDTSGQTLSGRVMSMGPIVDEVPVRCRRDPRLPAWGRDVVIVLDDQRALVPGQAFYVAIDKGIVEPGKAVAASPTREKDADVQSMVVPKRLRAMSRLEPSGIVWVDQLSRYLMVSDDTGFKKANNHAPWLFGLDGTGRVDEEPIKVDGLNEINDLEAIASDGQGLYYILSSQSHNRKGKRKKNRQVFARLVLDGRNFRADGVVHLVESLKDAGQDFIESLGLKDLSMLDIEGMTVRNGSLLIGLKAPLDAQGKAIIWKMDFPERFFDTGNIRNCGLSHWSSVQLQVQADNAAVAGGISELLALPDGTLLIAATASGIDARSQDGAIYFAKKPAIGTTYARKVREFVGLKPEGLALSPAAGRFMVVFDRGDDIPSWLEIPWPSY
jgi:multidrug resistance efflux pump